MATQLAPKLQIPVPPLLLSSYSQAPPCHVANRECLSVKVEGRAQQLTVRNDALLHNAVVVEA